SHPGGASPAEIRGESLGGAHVGERRAVRDLAGETTWRGRGLPEGLGGGAWGRGLGEGLGGGEALNGPRATTERLRIPGGWRAPPTLRAPLPPSVHRRRQCRSHPRRAGRARGSMLQC